MFDLNIGGSQSNSEGPIPHIFAKSEMGICCVVEAVRSPINAISGNIVSCGRCGNLLSSEDKIATFAKTKLDDINHVLKPSLGKDEAVQSVLLSRICFESYQIDKIKNVLGLNNLVLTKMDDFDVFINRPFSWFKEGSYRVIPGLEGQYYFIGSLKNDRMGKRPSKEELASVPIDRSDI